MHVLIYLQNSIFRLKQASKLIINSDIGISFLQKNKASEFVGKARLIAVIFLSKKYFQADKSLFMSCLIYLE